MRDTFSQFLDRRTNELGEKIASESRSESEYREGLEYAIDILRDALAASNEMAGEDLP